MKTKTVSLYFQEDEINFIRAGFMASTAKSFGSYIWQLTREIIEQEIGPFEDFKKNKRIKNKNKE